MVSLALSSSPSSSSPSPSTSEMKLILPRKKAQSKIYAYRAPGIAWIAACLSSVFVLAFGPRMWAFSSATIHEATRGISESFIRLCPSLEPVNALIIRGSAWLAASVQGSDFEKEVVMVLVVCVTLLLFDISARKYYRDGEAYVEFFLEQRGDDEPFLKALCTWSRNNHNRVLNDCIAKNKKENKEYEKELKVN